MIRAIAYIEFFLAAIFTGFAVWSISGLYSCPENTADCGGWALLGFYAAAPAGLLTYIAAFWLLKSKQRRSQLLIVVALVWMLWLWFFA
ncbi:MAG: hypothetical protein ACRBCI_13240 [Cellvibrionaceae bacterium]